MQHVTRIPHRRQVNLPLPPFWWAPAAAPAAEASAPATAPDVSMEDGERPSPPSRAAREEHALLNDASDALAARQRQPRVQRGSYSYAASATGHAAPGRLI